MIKSAFPISLLLFFLLIQNIIPQSARAQSEVDATRYSTQGQGITARALAMGGAYTAVADDYSAVFFNPAGLAQMRRLEFNAGFNFLNAGSDATYLGKTVTADNPVTALNSLGLVLPVPTYRGSLVFAFGYNRSQNFNTAQNIDAFNSSGSINTYFQKFTPQFGNDGIILQDYGSLAYNAFLLNEDGGTNPRYIDPRITGNVQQQSKLLEDGGTNSFVLSGALEAAPSLFLGATLNFINGRYSYARTYSEQDVSNVYANFNSFTLKDDIESDVNGFNLKAGLLYRLDDAWRFGLTVETPTYFRLKDRYSSSLGVSFSTSDSSTDASNNFYDGEFEYELTTPFVFSGGLSYEFLFLTLSGNVTFKDWTQQRYITSELSDVNALFKSDFQQTLDFAVGGELRVPATPVRLRAGYSIENSPYKFKLAAPSATPSVRTDLNDARKTLSLGAGLLFRKTFAIDVAYLYTTQILESRPYPTADVITESVKATNVVVTASFRF